MKPFLHFDEELDVSDLNYLLLNAPRRYLDGYSWYGEPPRQKAGVLRIRQRLFAMMDELAMQGWKSENVFFLGFSQGSLISADFALNYPERLAGIIGVSGYFCFFPRWKKQLRGSRKKTPWLFTHGQQDDVLSIENTQFGVEKLKSAGLDVHWTPIQKKHVFAEEDFPIIRNWLRQKI